MTTKKKKKNDTNDTMTVPEKPKISAVLMSVSLGVTITEACEKAGIGRKTFYRWKDADPKNEARYKEAVAESISGVESALREKAIKGDVQAIKFFLTNRSPSNWKEKVNPEDDPNFKPLTINITTTKRPT
jgi:transposase-like protein